MALDLLISNGLLRTQDPALPEAEALGVAAGRIAVVGSRADVEAAAGPATRRLDLGGRVLIPAFNDAHAHVWKMGHLLTSLLDLRSARSLEEVVRRVGERAAALPAGAWLLGRGFNEAIYPERRAPTRDDLDRAAPDRPVALTRTCGHIYAVNSRALELARVGPETPPPVGGVIERSGDGRPNGILHETAMGLVTSVVPPPTPDEYRAMVDAALRHQLSLGITASSDCGVGPPLLEVYRAMDRDGALPARVNVMPLRRVDGVAYPVPLPSQHQSDRLRIDTVKFLADGGLSGATAALSVSYRHTANRGVLRFDPDELRALAREAHDAGWRVAIHAIGDVAIDQVLDLYAELGPHPRHWHHRIEHLGLPSSDQLTRAARLGVISVPQTVFIHSLGPNFRAYLPDALLPRTYPVRAMLDAGLVVALSSDAPVVDDDNPLLGMSAAVTRRDREGVTVVGEQAITAAEALYAYTMGGALASGDEANRGSLTPGKWADLAVLSADPLLAPPEALTGISVDLTLLAGQVVHER